MIRVATVAECGAPLRPSIRRAARVACLVATVVTASRGSAQSGPRSDPSPAGPPVRSLGSVLATSAVTFSAVSQLVPLSDGRVLVSDASRRIVQLLDGSLANPVVVLDSTAGHQNSFTPQSFLSTFRGDSALFFDYAARAFVVIEPSGRLGRVMAPPATGPGLAFSTGASRPASSPTLGLEYQAFASVRDARPRGTDLPYLVQRRDDSTFVVRMDFATRALDTLAKIGSGNRRLEEFKAGSASPSRALVGPAIFPFFDDAVITTDGSIAVFHAREYRLDWIGADGQRGAGTRLTYPWQRITDDERQHAVDSVNALRQRLYDSAMAKRAADSSRTGGPPMRMATVMSPSGERTSHPTPIPAAPPPLFATADDIPDFRPPTGRGAVWADGDNHVWICPIPTQPVAGFAVWDVIDRRGAVIDRVRIPDHRTIAGFGPGVVYLIAQVGVESALEKVRVK